MKVVPRFFYLFSNRMEIKEILENTLRKEPNLLSDKGEIKKWIVINKAQNYDETLLGLLLDEPRLKTLFFKEIKNALVFNLNLFTDFIEQKEFLPDSYTGFPNKIGLQIGGKFLRQRNEVSLVWPYKDCVLEGGQSREEDARKEIFFNELLAQDEITQLFEPKVITNVQYFGDAKELTPTSNLLIKGNNLLALHSLKKRFTGKVKLIYIDPPYNTGNDGFRYNDSFNHSSWLTFMKNRLEVARTLLREDGTIAISIDQNESIYTQILCDEIFGRKYRKNIITVKRSSVSGAKVINLGVVNVSEFLLIYCKNPNEWKPNRVFRSKKRDERYSNYITNFEQHPSTWEFSSVLDAWAISIGLEKNKLKKYFGDEYEEKLDTFYYDNANRVFQFVSLDENAVSDAVVKLKNESKNDSLKVYILERRDKLNYYIYKGKALLFLSNRLTEIDNKKVFGELITDIWDDVLPNDLHNEGGVSLKKGKKPEKLIQRILQLLTNPDDIVLDYHLGSGTTAAVAHKMGRQWIGVEQLNYGRDDSKIRLHNVITGEQSGISKAVNWQGGGSFVYLELKKYNEHFIEKIREAQSADELLIIWEEMKEVSFMNYNIDIRDQNKAIEELKTHSLEVQKQKLVSILDKNQLYVSVSNMDDAQYGVTQEEKEFTKAFYQND